MRSQQRQRRDTAREDLARRRANERLRQIQALAQLDCLSGVPPESLARLATCATLRAFGPGTVMVNERGPAAFLSLILRGTVSLTLHDRAGHESLIGVLNRGDCFGEGALFGDRFRGVTAQADTICYLLQLSLADVRAALDASPELEQTLRRIYQRRLVESTLGRVPLFSQLAPVDRMHIADLLRPASFSRGTVVLHEGAIGEALYMLVSGQVVVEQSGQAIAYLEEGDFFGEMSLLTRRPHNADVRALTPVEVLALPAANLDALLASQPALAAQLAEVVERRKASSLAMRGDVERQTQLTALLQHGLRRGSHVLVRDQNLCKPGCRICEDACAARHGTSRLRVAGFTVNGLDVADACRQCRVGAECVEACPENAIVWNDAGALIVTDGCTACGECVPACPYDAIHLTPADAHRHSPLWGLWQRLQQFRTPTIPLEPVNRLQQRANKCDLCHGHRDLACISACPTGALRLVPVEEVFPL